MDLLIIGLNYAPEPVGIGPYTAGLAEAMAGRGHRVSAIAGKPYYPQWRRYPGQPRGVTTSCESGVAVTRVPHYIPRVPTGPKRIAHHASFAGRAVLPALRKAGAGCDLVFAVAPSLISVPLAAAAAQRAGAPLWIHVQDFEVDAAIATGLMRPGTRASRAATGLEQRVLARADMVSTISPQMCARLTEKGVPADRIFELRNWSNMAATAPSAGTYREDWGIGDRHVALYSGNIANKQGIEIVIEAARMVRYRDDLVFVICGEGPNRSRLADLASDLPNVQLHDLQPAKRLGELLALASVHLLPQIAGAADLVLPSKLTNMLASGRPVVATAAPGTGLHAEVEGCGVATPPGDSAAFAEAITALIDDGDKRHRLGQAAVERAEQRWSRDAIIDRFEQSAQALVEGRTPP